MPAAKDGLQMDRKDNDGGYELSNIRFVTRSTNLKNTRRSAKIQSDVDRVTYHARDRKWEVTYKFRFKTQEEAEQFAKENNKWPSAL